MSKVQRFYTHAAAFVTDDSGDQNTFVRTSVYRELERQLAEAQKDAEKAIRAVADCYHEGAAIHLYVDELIRAVNHLEAM